MQVIDPYSKTIFSQAMYINCYFIYNGSILLRRDDNEQSNSKSIW